MWEPYQPPGEEPAEPTAPPQPIVAGGTRSGSGAGILVALVASLAFIGVTVGAVGSAEPDYSGFYACVAEKEAEDSNSLLSPAEWCDNGNERPPDYVDDHEYDPFEHIDSDDDGFTY